MSCTTTTIFYRICGHIAKHVAHTPTCKAGKGVYAKAHPRALRLGCWNILPSKTKTLYVVGKCLSCSSDGRSMLATEPAAQAIIELGDGYQTIQNPGPQRVCDIISAARNFRAEVERQERVALTRPKEMEREERLALIRSQMETQWMMDFDAYVANPENADDGKPHIYDLSKPIFDEENGLLTRVDPEEAVHEDCAFCQGLEREILVKLPCGHVFHLKEIIVYFATKEINVETRQRGPKNCPNCRQGPYNLIVRGGFDEPVMRWYEDDLKEYQVGGYTRFTPWNQFSRLNFRPFQDEDRWGDAYDENHPVYQPRYVPLDQRPRADAPPVQRPLEQIIAHHQHDIEADDAWPIEYEEDEALQQALGNDDARREQYFDDEEADNEYEEVQVVEIVIHDDEDVVDEDRDPGHE